MATTILHLIQRTGITIQRKVTQTLIRVARVLGLGIIHQKRRAMVVADQSIQDHKAVNTISTKTEIKFMCQSSKSRKWIVGLLLLISSTGYAQNNLSGIGSLDALTGALKGWQAGAAQRDYQEALNQAYIEECRANTPSVLASLSSQCISRETQQIILATLNYALEMDAPFNYRNWQNKNKGSSGYVTIKNETSSQYSDTCRGFEISFVFDGDKNSSSGIACKSKSGQWNLL